MRDIVLKFVGSDIAIVETFTMCAEKINEKKQLAAFTFVLGQSLMRTVRVIPGISYVAEKKFIESRYSRYSLANRVLHNIPKYMWYEASLKFLTNKYRIGLNEKKFTISKKHKWWDRDNSKCSILFQSTYNPCDGYGSSAEALALQAAKLDKQFRWQPFHRSSDADSHAQSRTKLLLNRSLGYIAPDHYFLYHTPNFRPPEYYRAKKGGASLSLLTMFETTSVPYIWPTRINEWFDRLIVPSTFCKDLFSREGVKIPIEIVPLGVDPDRWPYVERVPPENRPFRFLVFANARWDCPRKNFDIVVDAFTDRFANRKDVELVIKSSPGAKAARRTSLPSNVRVIEERLPQYRIVELLHSVDCLVFPSSGEGFGLPPREAMATGLPVIVTNWGGLAEIARPDISFPLEPSGMKSASHLCDWLADEPGGMELGQMAKVSHVDLADIMERVFKDQEGAFKIGYAGYQYVLNNETYLHSVTKLYRILYPETFRSHLCLPSKEAIMKLDIKKISRRKTKRFIYFTVENTSSEALVASKSLFVRFKRIKKEDGTIQTDPEWGRFEMPQQIASGEVIEGRITINISKTGLFVGDLGVVNTGVKWFDTEEVVVD